MVLASEKLAEIVSSKNFCILPWLHLHVMPDSSVTPCCISPYDDTYGNGAKQSLEEIWNSEKFKKLRLNMLNNLPSEGCARCYKVEASGFESMREINNIEFEKHLPIVLDTEADGGIKTPTFKYIDIRFSNLCNFKCRGCGPTLSSSWFDDHQELHNFISKDEKVRSVSIGSPDFWRELKSLIPHAEMMYFGGGEPLITKEHFEVLKMLESLEKFDVGLRYNTNLSQLNYGAVNLDEIWAKFHRVSLGISIDDIGPRAEYFRHGTKWNVIEKNIKKIVENYAHVERYVNCTVNIMNVYYLPEIYTYLLKNNIISTNSFNMNLLLDPLELRVQVLPFKLKNKIRERLKVFQQNLQKKGLPFKKAADDFANLILFLDEEDMSDQLPVFRANTLKLDSLRKENFLVTFPELIELFEP